MKVRLYCILFVTVLLLPSLVTGQAISPTVEEHEVLATEVDVPSEITDEDILLVLESITLDEIFAHVEEYSTSLGASSWITTSFQRGLTQAEDLGIRRSHTLRDLFTFFIGKKETTKHRWFLCAVLPRRAIVSTYMPSTVVNLTHVNTSLGDIPIQLELFVKTIPLLDRIQTTQYGILRPQLSQKTVWWPAIGVRITFGGWFTLGIIAFGPRIQWTREPLRADTDKKLL
jgi:hypothetical protein